MDKNQITNVLQVVSNIENCDIDKMAEAIFKDQDVTTVNIGTYVFPDYVVALKRMLKQFTVELSDNGIYIPFQYTFQNEFGNGTFQLQTELQKLLDLLKQNSLTGITQSVPFLKRLIYIQVINGFWDKSKTKIHKADEIKISELNEKLKIISEQLSVNQGSFKTQIDNLDLEKKKLADFLAQKQQELQKITLNLQTTNTNTNEISNLLTTSTATNGKIDALLGQQNQNFETQKKKAEAEDVYFAKQKETFGTLETNLKEKVKVLETQIASFEEKLKFVEDKKAFFEERNIYLQNLIGREVGVSLFETFKQRKTELTKPVSKWLWIVIGMATLTFISIITIFTNGFGLWGEVPKDFTTIQLITNTIKTFPFFFLLFYAISQYNKERNFQEEYAFKSAVALTIKAYADIVVDEKLKDEMIISSVNAVYKSPTVEKGRNKKENNEILETAKELLGTAVDIVKKK
ncbi:hypothetical protein [Fluviicola sp.]|jgi:hypothetical protein|uniref:coiled-coil domain-containing protein n=1 Tax=Fluviicola sp. TaxID=1917219 RepID=UPI00282676B0|nr:hypothetical protein [Fluviicola sp.]MDR0801372.1 hypothetical protein [Fluviicola sp.]